MTGTSLIVTRIKVTQSLILVNAGMWLIIPIYSWLRLAQKGPSTLNTLMGWVMLILPVFMLVNAGFLLFCGIRLPQGSKKVYWFSVFIISVNAILSITDQIGPMDIASLLLNLLILGRLLLYRKFFINSQ